MTQSGVSAFARFARGLANAAVLLVLSAGALLAQGTGKIEGRVRDQAGAPIQNAQVVVVGTAFSALTNPQGYYFINNVPAGTISLRASFIGYKRTEVAGLKVLAGQTMTQDIQLESSPVVVEEITVVGADQPLVPRDQVTTKQVADGEFTSDLPVDRINNVLLLQPGVVANSSGSAISIRGGRDDEAITVIDGVPVQPGNRGDGFVTMGGNSITVGTNSFEEVSVTTGAAAAEFGNAQSGVINIATRTGGAAFAGRLAMESDEAFGKATSIGFNRVEGNLSGPLFGGLTFSLSGVLEGQKSRNEGKGREDIPLFVLAGQDTTVTNGVGGPTLPVNAYRQFTGSCDTFSGSTNADIANNYGESCEGSRTPNSATSAYQFGGNLNYSYGTGSRLRFSALRSQNQGRLFAPGNGYGLSMNLPSAQLGQRSWNGVYTLNWTQNLAKSAERALALDVALSYQTDRFIQSPVADGGPGEGTLGFYLKPIPLQFGFDNFPLDEARLTCFVRNQTECIGPFDVTNQASLDSVAFQTDLRTNAYGLQNSTFPYAGLGQGRLALNEENRYIARGNLDWQLDRYNRVKIGGEFTQYEINSYSVTITSQAFSDYFREKPQLMGLFVEDRLDLGDVVVQAGLRYDWYDSRASRPFVVDTLSTGEIFETFYPRVSSSDKVPTGEDPRNFVYRRDQSHDYFSPRIQVAFPVTEKTNFRLSYAHAVQAPDFSLILGGINTDRLVTNTNHVFGSDLDFGKTITFEFGIRHAFNDDMVLDLAAYNRDNLANAAGRLVRTYDPNSTDSPVFEDLRFITNSDFGNTRGLDLRLDRRFGQLFNGTIAYSFTDARSTGSDPFTYINFGSRVVNTVSGGNAPPPQAIAPTQLSRPHNLTAAVSLTFPNDWRQGTTVGTIFENFNVFAGFRYASGTAYTGCSEDGNQSVLSGGVCARGGLGPQGGGLNTERLPTFKQLDMRFVKGFKLGGNDLSVYLDARNILNFTNVLQVFVVTNDIVSPIERDQQWTADSLRYSQEAAANSRELAGGGMDLNGINCTVWEDQGGAAAAPNCVYLIRAEQRWGNGDGIFDVTEQRRAALSNYESNNRGPNSFYGAPRRLRLGVEFNF